MSDLPPPSVSPHHNQQTHRRHRLRTRWAVLVLSAAVALSIAGWLSEPPLAPLARIVVTLPPSPAPESTRANNSSLAPASDLPADRIAATSEPQAPLAASNDAAAQTAILPPGPDARVARDERPAWLRFAMAAPVDVVDKPRVAIVIDDLGPDRARTARVIALAPAVTLSFLAYSDDLPRVTTAARRAGHEMIVHVPMEPLSAKMDMGPNGLATNQTKEEVLRRLNWDLDRFEGYVGINNHMGSRFTGDAQAMGWVMDELKARGLMFLDSRTIATTIAAKAAAADGVPFAEREVFLDDEQNSAAVDQQLAALEGLAKRKGTAIGIGHPHDATIAALSRWIAALPQKGIALVPLTDVVKARLGPS
jgi:polysaccharide deacetylase 2 family uncharacterized protein YibQ